MKAVALIVVALVLTSCSPVTVTRGDSITSAELEDLYRKHAVDGNHAVALKKYSIADSYLATIHGYPNNLAVCEQLIEPYNKDPSLSVASGYYYCMELR